MSHSLLVLTLSIAVLPGLVNAQSQSLTSPNNSLRKSELKDSVKDTGTDLANLIEILDKTGKNSRYEGPHAAALGFAKTTLNKTRKEETLKDKVRDIRLCQLAYEEKRPVCLIIVRKLKTEQGSETISYRVSLDGKLEKVDALYGKYDESGKPISASVLNRDIESPEVKKAFNAEMAYWLKDWLKNEKKAADKKAAEVTKPIKTASL